MAAQNSNNVYLSWNGTQIDAYWTDQIDFSESGSSEDVTHGSGQTHTQRLPGLIDNSMTFAIVMDSTNYDTIKSNLVINTQGTLIYGPLGNASGKPKFTCEMILASKRGPNPSVGKSKIMIELTFEQADAPTETLAADTF